MEKLVICIEMENWDRADTFADNIKQLVAEDTGSVFLTLTENENVLPLPFSLSTLTLPPIISTRFLTILSPRPVPPNLLEYP